MMRWKLWLMLFIFVALPVVAQVPVDTSSQVTQQIANEHKLTRKFFSDELTRQREDFYAEMEDRALYYENLLDDMITSAVWKLGLLWVSIVLIVTSFNNFLQKRLKKREYARLVDAITKEVKEEVLKQNKIELAQRQTLDRTIQVRNQELQKRQQAMAQAKPQLDALKQQMQQSQQKMEQIMQGIMSDGK